MLLERIYDEDLAQASYFVGCQANGEAVVIDPRRDISVYIDLAAQHGMTITSVTETHIHADYLSGTRELSAHTGAAMFVSDEGGPDWTYGAGFDDAVRMKDGHRITIGNLTLDAVHTPGHTPEHLSFLLTDGAQATEPGFLFSGDFVFVGDVGRPDLLDEAAGFTDTRFVGAKDLYTSLRDRFLVLPDYVQVLPAHGSGSACGKALGAVAATTVGYERNFSWWGQYLRNADETGFIAELLSGQPDAHAYFGRMKRENTEGPELLGTPAPLQEYLGRDVVSQVKDGDLVFIDTREHSLVHTGTPDGALNVPGVTKSASYAAWVINPETETRPVVLLATDLDEAEQFRRHFVRVGIDHIVGFVTSLGEIPLVRPVLVSVDELEHTAHAVLLDVRNKTEHATGHLPGAQQLSGGRLLWNLESLPPADAGLFVTYCQSGVRNSVASSALRAAGYSVAELQGSFNAWASKPDNIPVVLE